MPKKRDTHIPTFVELAAKLRMDGGPQADPDDSRPQEAA